MQGRGRCLAEESEQTGRDGFGQDIFVEMAQPLVEVGQVPLVLLADTGPFCDVRCGESLVVGLYHLLKLTTFPPSRESSRF